MHNEATAEETAPKETKSRNKTKGGPPRDSKTADYLPDPAAEGNPHTTLGIREGSSGPYMQGATFESSGKFKGRTDVTTHGRGDHPNPHFHPATSSNGANGGFQPISEFFQ